MSIARSYASALYEAAKEKGLGAADVDSIDAQLGEFVRVLNSSKEARIGLMSPATSSKEKTQVVTELAAKMRAHALTAQFLALLARKERLALARDIHEAFARVRLEAEGGVMGQVVSADPMEQADLDGLAKAFGQKLGKRVSFQTETDPNLLAGMKVTVNGVTYDGTLRSQLQRLKDRLVLNTEMVH